MKTDRQKIILDAVRTRNIYTQEEINQVLKNAGFDVAQATVSRDIRELRIGREQTPEGQRYVAPTSGNTTFRELDIMRIFNDSLLSANSAGNMLVLRTFSGMGMAAALAIDSLNLPEILGCVPGDDTILCVITNETEAKKLAERFCPQ